MAPFLQAVRLAKLPHCIPVLPRAHPIVSFSKIDRDRHELDMMAKRTNGAIGYPGNVSRLAALRNHPLRSANGTFAEFSRESCLNSHIMHVTFGQVRSRNLQPLSDAVIAVRYTRICLRKSVARFLCRILLPNGVGICGSYHPATAITLGPARPPGRPKANR